jgi:hypothetical protein
MFGEVLIGQRLCNGVRRACSVTRCLHDVTPAQVGAKIFLHNQLG